MFVEDYDEVSTAMLCLMSEQELKEAEIESEKEFGYSDEVALDDYDACSIVLDESDTDPVGVEAEDAIDVEQELFSDDEDGDLIDLVASDESI